MRFGGIESGVGMALATATRAVREGLEDTGGRQSQPRKHGDSKQRTSATIKNSRGTVSRVQTSSGSYRKIPEAVQLGWILDDMSRRQWCQWCRGGVN